MTMLNSAAWVLGYSLMFVILTGVLLRLTRAARKKLQGPYLSWAGDMSKATRGSDAARALGYSKKWTFLFYGISLRRWGLGFVRLKVSPEEAEES